MGMCWRSPAFWKTSFLPLTLMRGAFLLSGMCGQGSGAGGTTVGSIGLCIAIAHCQLFSFSSAAI